MQLPLQLLTFEDQDHNRIRTVTIDDAVWFYGIDVCTALDIKNPRDAFSRLDEDEKRTVGTADASSQVTRVNPLLISESGLYNLVFQSRKDGAKRFRKWVTSEVLPLLRKTGGYNLPGGSGTPSFIRRFNENWDRTDPGYFSVIGELGIRLFGRLEMLGHVMPDQGAHGKEMRPDVSVGRHFSKWIGVEHPDHCEKRKNYRHKLPGGNEVEAFQYPLETLPIFIKYVDEVWMREHAPEYLQDKDPAALAYLPKLLPISSVPPKAAANRFEEMRQALKNPPKK